MTSMAYKTARNYLSMPIVCRRILDDYYNTGDKRELFLSIKANVNKMGKDSTRYTRQSSFRGALKNLFNFTEADMEPIKFTIEESTAFNNELNSRLDDKTEMKIDASTLRDMIQAEPIIELLCRSGVRIAELFERITIVGSTVYIEAYKKGPDKRVPEELHILGDTDDWIRKYKAVDLSNLSASSRKINRKLKMIIPSDQEKQSSHLCRAIYARYVYQFENDNDLPLNTIIRKYLHHDSGISAIHYQYVVLASDVKDIFNRSGRITYTKEQLTAMDCPRLTELLITHNVAGRSSMRKKADKITALLLI